jgi:hypothetical protein
MCVDYYINLVGKAGQYICPICGCVNDQNVMTRDQYAARLAGWSSLDVEAQTRQVEDVFRFAFEGKIAMNTRCYDSYCNYPVVDLDALARMARKRCDRPKAWFLARALHAADIFKKRNSFRAYSIFGAYVDMWEWNHPDEELKA